MTTKDQSTNPPVVFNFGTQSIRTIDQDGEVWFVANDVCAALDIANPRQAVGRLDDDEGGVISTDTPSKNQHGAFGTVKQELSIISESGLYSLVMSSRKAEAKQFKRWVTHDVLPAIRKTGRYEAPSQAAAVEPQTREEMLVEALQHGRWFMSARDGRLSLSPIREDAYVIAADEFAKVIREPGEVSLRLLPEIIEAAAGRLRNYYGEKK